MTHQFRPLAPFAGRKATHPLHFMEFEAENRGPGALSLLEGEHSTFPVGRFNGTILLGPPFEEELEDPLADIIDALSGEVRIEGFRPSQIHRKAGQPLVFHGSWSNNRLYQRPHARELYHRRLDRFRKDGFCVRTLTTEDAPDLSDLYRSWHRSRVDRAQRVLAGTDPARKEEKRLLNLQIEQLKSEREAVDTPYIRRLITQPHGTMRGCYRDERLLACIHTKGNDHYQLLDFRKCRRTRGRSAQEFLDLTVFEEFAARGVPLIDRGYFNLHAGASGLLEYKTKFGPVTFVQEYCAERVISGFSLPAGIAFRS